MLDHFTDFLLRVKVTTAGLDFAIQPMERAS